MSSWRIESRAAVAGVAFVAAAVTGGSAQAEIVVAAGQLASLLTLYSIDQTCKSIGPVTINVIEPPRGGYVEVMQVKAYPNFNTLNTRSRCNTMKLPATRLMYQSAGTYLGLDSVFVEAIFPGGGARRFRIPISIRPVTPDFKPAPPPGSEALAATPSAPPRPRKAVRHAHAIAPDHRRGCKNSCPSERKPTDAPASSHASPVSI